MHEMGIVDGMLNTIDSLVEEHGLTRVDKIVLQVGDISGVIPMFVQRAYDLMVSGTKYEKTILEIEELKGIVRCNLCQHEFYAVENDHRCPKCGQRNMTPLSGRECFIKEIVAL